MPDLLALSQGFQAIRSAGEIAQAMIGLRDAAKLLENTVELNRKIADALAALNAALSEQSSLVKMIDDKEKEIADLKAWDADKKRYKMEERPPGIVIYTLKQEAAEPGEPIHSICATCHANNKKSYLQKGETRHGVYNLTCKTCGPLAVGTYSAPPIRKGKRPSSPWGA